MLEIEQTTVQLGEREYTIRQAGFRRSKPWKKRLLAEVKPLFTQMAGVSDIQFDTPEDLLQLLPIMEQLFVDGIETILDMLIGYAPELEADRDYIEEHATDKQIFAGFQEVIRLADFFGMTGQINRRIGREMTGTSSNSPSVNGTSAQTTPHDSQTVNSTG